MFAAGAAIFALLYSVQALLPQLATAFGVGPADAALAMSLATAAIALAVIPASALSERWGRSRVLVGSVVVAAVLGVLLPLSPDFAVLLAIRTLQGVAMAGMPAVAMAYLADEIHPSALAGAVGTFVAGNGLGGLAGRLLAGVATDAGGWRAGLAAVSGLSIGCAAAFWALLPAQRHGARVVVRGGLCRHLRDPALRRLYLAGFALSGGFVTVYNYLGFRLLGAPFHLSPALVGLIFLAYLAGTAASAAAGRLADRHGPPGVLAAAVVLAVLGVLATLPDWLPTVLVGLVLVTAGFFAGHAVAGGWVSRTADTARGQAAGLYLFAFYAGGSVGGWLGGLVFEHAGWTATALYVVALFAVGLAPVVRWRAGRGRATAPSRTSSPGGPPAWRGSSRPRARRGSTTPRSARTSSR
jgi:predicted MFS family arabinose efflux permease